MGDGGQPGRALPQGTLLPLAQDQAVWTHPLIQRGKVPGVDSLSVAEQRNPQRNMDFPLCTMGSRRMMCVALHLAAGRENRQDLGEDGGWQSRLGATAEGQQPGEAEAVGADLRGQT